MAKKKYYAVSKGRNTGIFTTWDETKNSVDGYKGAVYKSFPTLAEAEKWLKNPVITKTKSVKKTVKAPAEKPVGNDSTVIIYSDGGSINNPGPGGYGAVIIRGNDIKEIAEGFRLTTNNRMELLGVISALMAIGSTSLPIQVYTDSRYVVNGMSKGWARSWKKKGWRKSNNEPALNSDLWEKLLQLDNKLKIQYNWVKGHAGNYYNERCDELAVQSARSNNQKIDSEYEKNSC